MIQQQQKDESTYTSRVDCSNLESTRVEPDDFLLHLLCVVEAVITEVDVALQRESELSMGPLASGD